MDNAYPNRITKKTTLHQFSEEVYSKTRECSPRLFHSKAETLAFLQQHEELHIPPLMYFSVGEWNSHPEKITSQLDEFGKMAQSSVFAVRSSCSMEDSLESSGAGMFNSVLNVLQEDFTVAVEKVISSYGAVDDAEQVLIQPMLCNIILSGVIMTKVLTDGAPYYVVNYDDSGKTDCVTGGQGTSKTVFVFRDAKSEDFDSPRLKSIVDLARRVESLCVRNDLDIEFCMEADGTLHLLQVRPMCTQGYWIPHVDTKVRSHINFISNYLRGRMSRRPGLYGDTTILGVMSDWNPAEMLGLTPRRLACSLYRELITRRVWSHARELMGYRPLPPEELMLLIAGRPYIDIRLSCNSFLPTGIDTISGESLVAAWLDRLDRNPSLHDKLEFAVAQTCLDFSFDVNMDAHYPDVLSRSRRKTYRELLRGLTLRCMDLGKTGSMIAAFDAIAELRGLQLSLPRPSTNIATTEYLPLIARLIEECSTLGTLPFSVLARHAFIAESLLRSAVERNALTTERLAQFKASLRTVAGEFATDFDAAARGQLSKESFFAKYGHLRPSTYDILSPSYAQRQNMFDAGNGRIIPPLKEQIFTFTSEEVHSLRQLLAEAGLPEDVDRLEAYVRKAIPGREMAKFVFTRHVSAILDLIVSWGTSLELGKDDLSFLDVRDILEWDNQSLLRTPKTYFTELAEQGRQLFDLGRSLKLGYLIRSPRDVKVVAQHRSAPNFIGSEKVEAPVHSLTPDSECTSDIDGHIVCIENADPGFDWIFTRRIAGLVTMFGGTNSHMAIRCAEYGLTAAIGVGEVLFEQITHMGHCLLHPREGVLRALSEVEL